MLKQLAGPNILITASSSKVLLVEAFKKAVDSKAEVFTTDLTHDCASAFFSDGHFVVGPTADPETIDRLIQICTANQIGLLVPTRDDDLEIFSNLRGRFLDAGIFVPVPSPDVIRICRNKRSFSEFLSKHGLPSIPILNPDERQLQFPVFVRPISGAGGRGARRIDSEDGIGALRSLDGYLIHPFIDAREFTIDLLMDLEGRRALQAVCRERVRVSAGESKISRVEKIPELEVLAIKIGELLGLVAHNTVQAFYDPNTGPCLIEINPRFGGASNLSIRAGLDSPRRLVQMLRGDPAALSARKIFVGATMYRYSQDVIIGVGNDQ